MVDVSAIWRQTAGRALPSGDLSPDSAAPPPVPAREPMALTVRTITRRGRKTQISDQLAWTF
ncbi:MAG: hypothetical protein OWU84_02435 [Firmicutes bacterium]|nr:hypothetical protein [Bacillota bacterium]